MSKFLDKVKASDNAVIVISIVVGGLLVGLLDLKLEQSAIDAISSFIVDLM